MLGHLGQEPDARLHRGARYQPQRGLIQIGAIAKSRILPPINQRVHHHPFAATGSPPVPARAADQLPGPQVVQVKVVLPLRSFCGALPGAFDRPAVAGETPGVALPEAGGLSPQLPDAVVQAHLADAGESGESQWCWQKVSANSLRPMIASRSGRWEWPAMKRWQGKQPVQPRERGPATAAGDPGDCRGPK